MRTEPSTSKSLLSTGLTEWGRADERLPGIGPAVWMGSMCVVIVHVGMQAPDEFFGRCEVTPFEPAASECAEPEFDPIEPRAVFGREMKNVLVAWIGKEGTSFAAGS